MFLGRNSWEPEIKALRQRGAQYSVGVICRTEPQFVWVCEKSELKPERAHEPACSGPRHGKV